MKPKQVEHFIDFPQEVHPERLFVVAQTQLILQAGGAVMDVGCGTHKTLPEMTGLDIRPGVTDLVGSAEALPVEDGQLDAIVMRHSLEHVLDQVRAVQEWKRALRWGGRVIVILPDHGAIDTMDPRLSSNEHLHAYSMASFRLFMGLFSHLCLTSCEVVIPDWSFGAVIEHVASFP